MKYLGAQSDGQDLATVNGSSVTVAFTAASSRTNISTGEKLSVLFGKIAKWFTDLGTAAFRAATSSITQDSTDLIESGAVYTGLASKADKTALETYVRPNLLDNPYFVYGKAINNDYSNANTWPINQRGQQSYNGSGYGIDRWSCPGNGVHTVAIASDGSGVNISLSSNDNFLQIVSGCGRVIKDVPVTITVLVSAFSKTGNGKIIFGLQNNNWQHLFTTEIDGTGLFTGTSTVSSNLTDDLRLTISNDDDSTACSMTIKAVKLEIGAYQTLAHQEGSTWVLNEIPDYATELAKCQRYQIMHIGNGAAGYINGSEAHLFVPTPVTMRANPSISMAFANNVIAGSNIYAVSSVSNQGTAGIAGIWVTCQTSRGSGGIVACVNADTSFNFDANLS